jgi:hypothetical protein
MAGYSAYSLRHSEEIGYYPLLYTLLSVITAFLAVEKLKNP